jgi:hypothetical protein
MSCTCFTTDTTCLYRSGITYGFNEASTSHDPGSHSTGDRLKPPPDAINLEHRKIKLNSRSSSSDDLESVRIKRLNKFENTDINGDILDRIIIKDRRKEKDRKSEAQNTKKTQADGSSTDTPLGQSESQHSGSSSCNKESGSRKIKLKRSHSSFSSEVRPFALSSPIIVHMHRIFYITGSQNITCYRTLVMMRAVIAQLV